MLSWPWATCCCRPLSPSPSVPVRPRARTFRLICSHYPSACPGVQPWETPGFTVAQLNNISHFIFYFFYFFCASTGFSPFFSQRSFFSFLCLIFCCCVVIVVCCHIIFDLCASNCVSDCPCYHPYSMPLFLARATNTARALPSAWKLVEIL